MVTDRQVQIWQLIQVSKGTRDFVKLMFVFPNGAQSFYVNEIINGQPEMIENDEEFEEIVAFMDLALARNQQGSGL